MSEDGELLDYDSASTTPRSSEYDDADVQIRAESESETPPTRRRSPARRPNSALAAALGRAERAREGVEDFMNDIHEAYSFDLDPEYRVKVVKRFDGIALGARYDLKSRVLKVKVKEAPRRDESDGRFKFWKVFKKAEYAPEGGVAEVFTRPLRLGILSLQAIGGYKQETGNFSFRWKATSTVWETSRGEVMRRTERDVNDRLSAALRWDLDVRPPKAEGGVSTGEGGESRAMDIDIGSYHVAVPRVELKLDLSGETEAARRRREGK